MMQKVGRFREVQSAGRKMCGGGALPAFPIGFRFMPLGGGTAGAGKHLPEVSFSSPSLHHARTFFTSSAVLLHPDRGGQKKNFPFLASVIGGGWNGTSHLRRDGLGTRRSSGKNWFAGGGSGWWRPPMMRGSSSPSSSTLLSSRAGTVDAPAPALYSPSSPRFGFAMAALSGAISLHHSRPSLNLLRYNTRSTAAANNNNNNRNNSAQVIMVSTETEAASRRDSNTNSSTRTCSNRGGVMMSGGGVHAAFQCRRRRIMTVTSSCCHRRMDLVRGERHLGYSPSLGVLSSPILVPQRCFFGGKRHGTSQKAIEKVDKDEEDGEGEDGAGEESPNKGYLPFRAPFHTFNIVMLLFLGNVICYLLMRFGDEHVQDFMVEHFTISRENWFRIYPLFTNAFFQENLLQLLIDCWLLSSVGTSLLNFIGNGRLTWLCMLCVLGGSLFHLAKQQYFLYNGEDELLVRGRVYGSNTFIMGLISLDGLIFRHLTFVQEPPIPYLVLTAFVMALDVWRIATVMPEEHGAATGGAIMALVFWALPIRFFGMDKLTAML